MKFRLMHSVLVISLMMLNAAFVNGQDLTGIKCVLDGDTQVDAAAAVEYRDGKVYFCCEGCAADFKSKMSDTDSELLVKANHQLVLTGQFKQTTCPLSGKAVAEDKTVDVGGVKVGFCCAGCQSAVNKEADLAGKAKKVFSNVAFEKGFTKSKGDPKLDDVKCFLMPKKDVKKDVSADYGDHKVYFCCKSCLNRFKKDPSKYEVQSNQHLVVTEQVKQSACPISGAATKDDQSSEVNGTKVNFCCGNCKSKVDNAAEAEKAELVFGKDAFAKGFK